MVLFQVNEDRIQVPQEKMYQALKIDVSKKQVIAVVGAGGKTTSIYHLAKELVALGKRVVITTTTHMFLPKAYGVLEENQKQVLEMLETDGLVVVGIPCGDEKMGKVSEPFFEWLRTVSDYILVEADGSKRLPIKVPAKHEPVLPMSTDLLIVVAGLSCLNQPLKEICHRWELAMELLKCEETAPITPTYVAQLLSKGYCAQYVIPYKILLNQCESKKAQDAMLEMMHVLSKNHILDTNVIWSSFILN